MTILELLAVVAVLAILLALLIPLISRARAASRSVTCLANLHQLAVAFHGYAHDNDSALPDPIDTGVPWEHSVARYVNSPASFVCPADDELHPATNLSSYDWRDTGKPASTLAGHSLSEIKRTGAVLLFDALPQWHQKHQINVAHVDGSAESIDQDECFRDLDAPIAR